MDGIDERMGCSNCKWWSEKIAQSIGGKPLEAYCLNPKSPNFGEYVTGRIICNEHEKGLPVDL